MRVHPLKWMFFVMFLAISSACLAAESGSLSSYRLGAGDMITIQVLGEEDLRRGPVRLSDAGTISFPVLGELQVTGTTVGHLEETIRNGLKGRYLQNPVVTVTIHEYRNFFIDGQVGRPGGYPYIPGLTIRKAVTTAGGFKERAAPDKIFVIRETDPTQKPRRVTLDSPVQPGDVITVEESFF